MTFDEIQENWGRDCKIDQDDLALSSAETPYLHHKYMREKAHAAINLRRQETELKRLTFLRTLYYQGELPLEKLKEKGWQPWPKRLLKVDVPSYVEADEIIIAQTIQVATSKEKVEYLTDVLKSLTSRNFIIKNILDQRRLESGGY